MPQQLVLVAVGDDGLATITCQAVEAAGHEPLRAETPEHAVSVAREQPPALVITDPPLSEGPPLAHRLHEDGATRDVPIVVFADGRWEEQALRAGALAFLSVPPSRTEIADTVAGLLASPDLRDTLEHALVHLRAARIDPASAALHKLSRTRSNDVISIWSRYFAAWSSAISNEGPAALGELAALQAERPSFWRAAARLGGIFEAAGRLEEAADHFRSVLRLRPRQGDVAASLQRVLDKRARGEGAPPAEPDADATPVHPIEALDVLEPVAGAMGSPATILVADDTEQALAMLSYLLKSAGYDVLRARDGMEALDAVRSCRPDLLVLDGLMPGLSGFDVCKRVKEELYPTDPPTVIILSALYTKQKQRSEALKLYRADEVLSKSSFDEDAFLALVRAHLEARLARSA